MLARSRVLIVGAGGLGSPGAAVSRGRGRRASSGWSMPTRCTRATCTASRSTRCRRSASRRRRSPSPRSQGSTPPCAFETHTTRFTAGNALELVRAHDVVVDCSDNFRTKFLINDAAVLARRPAVFASVYQYEGQMQVYRPLGSHACLRCLWPEASVDGIVGNCAEAGVLGPVPGTFGALQALLTLKILLGSPASSTANSCSWTS